MDLFDSLPIEETGLTAEQEIKAKRDACTEKLKPLREKLRCAENILKRSEKLYEILLAEREAEKQALQRERNRERTR